MSDLITLAIAAQTAKAAENAVVATWVGTVANFAVAGVAAAVSFHAHLEARAATRYARKRRDEDVLLSLGVAVSAMRLTWRSLEDELPDEPVDFRQVSVAIAHASNNIARTQASEVPDEYLAKLAQWLEYLVGSMREAFLVAEKAHPATTGRELTTRLASMKDHIDQALVDINGARAQRRLPPLEA